MASYQNSIMLGLKLESKDSIEGKLKTLIGTLNTTKIDLDINIKNSDVAKQLETLTNLANNFKNSLGGNINLGNVNEIINQATSSMERLNGEVLKTRTVLSKDGTNGNRYSDIANGIGVVTKQTEILNQETKKWELTEQGKTTTIVNNEKIRKTLDDIIQAQEKLNALESRGNVNTNETDRLKGLLNSASTNIQGKNDIYKSSEITGYLNEVKQLEIEEQNLKNIQDAKNKEIEEQYKLQQEDLKQLQQLEQQRVKEETDLINQMANAREKSQSSTQNRDSNDELAQANAINKSLEDNYKLKQKQEQDDIKLANQMQDTWDKTYQERVLSEQKALAEIETNEKKAYEQEILRLGEQAIAQQKAEQDLINAMANGREKSESKSQQSDRNQELNQAKSINKALEDEYKLQQQIKNSETNSLSKDINNTISQVEKLQTKFGQKLPNGFVESTIYDLNKMITELKEADGVSFNEMRNNLNSVKSSIEQVTNETKQLASTSNNSNGFFSNMSNFLGKIGIFYGVQQVVQEISQQFKNAGDYTQALDKNVTNIEMITGKSKNEVIGLTNQFKELGSQLHITNQEMLAGSEELLRAGYDNTTTDKMLQASAMASKISGQTTQATTEQLIAIKNGFNMTGDDMQHVIDTMATLDNHSATSFKEISDATMRTAQSAKLLNIPFDTLSTWITTVSEKTRREASTIGDSFRTIFARYQNIKLGNMDDDGKSINDVEKAMNAVQISIRTSKGEFKDFQEVYNTFIQKYQSGSMDQVHFLAGVEALSGVRQKETLLALIQNMDTVKQHQEQLTNSTGSAKQMYDVYSQSLEARIADLKRAFEGLYEKILSSDSLKWLVTEFTQLITALSQVDDKTILFTASIGGLVLVMSKLSALNKALIAGEAVTGLSKFIAVLSGMSTVEKTIEETTNATKALQLAQMGMVAETEGITGLKGAWLMLSTGIKEATASAMAFMFTPIGAMLGVLAITLGLVVGGFISVKAHEQALTKQSTDLKTALDGVNESLKNGDTKGASDQLDKAKSSYKELTDLIRQKNELISKPVPKEGTSDYYAQTGALQILNNKIAEHKKVLKDAGVTYDEVTGKVNEFEQAENAIKNTDIINKIKEQTKAQIESRSNTEANTEEYNKYIKTTQDLYAQYQNLSSQENLSAEQKKELTGVVEQLNDKVANLNIGIDSNGKAYIENTPLISDQISYMSQEGMTVDTLTAVRLSDAKACSEWQIGNTQITYSQTVQRIADYQTEINAIEQLISARAGAVDSSDYHKLFVAEQEQDKFKNAKDEMDKLYNQSALNIPKLSTPSVPDTSYTPSGGEDKKAKEAEDKAKKLAEEIDKMEAKFTVDPYFELNNAIKGVDNELTVNKTLIDSLTEGSPEYEKAQLAQIELDKKKQQSLIDLNDEQKKQANILKDYLTQYGFTTDEMGNLTNSQKQIEYWKNITDAMTGSTEEEKAKKQEWIDWISELEKKTSDYNSLVNDKIPSVANQWSAVGNEIKKTTEEIKKANEELKKTNIEKINNLKEELTQDYLKDQQEKVDALKEELANEKKNEIKDIEDEKTATLKSYDAEIKSKQAEIDALDTTSEDNQKKLKALQEEKALWEKETNNVFAKSKVESLTTQISDLEKTIKKDSLQKDIDNLNNEKTAESDSYDQRLSDLNDYYDEQEKTAQTTYDDMLDEKKAYAKADKMITQNQQDQMIELLKKYDTSYKTIGDTWSTNLTNPILEKIQSVETAYDSLVNKLAKEVNVNIGSDVASSGSDSNSSDNNSGNKTKVSGTTSDGQDYYYYTDSNSYSNSNSSDSSSNTTTGTLSDGTTYIIANKPFARYATGGRVSSNIGSDGGLAIVDENEKILNQKDTVMIDDIYNHVKIADATIMQLSNIIGSSSNYSLPSVIHGFDTNRFNGNVVNNSNDNSNYQPVQMSVSIVNHNGAEAVINEKSLEKMMTKIQKKQERRYK
jgi:TP901 family phage tail tape measure protein